MELTPLSSIRYIFRLANVYVEYLLMQQNTSDQDLGQSNWRCLLVCLPWHLTGGSDTPGASDYDHTGKLSPASMVLMALECELAQSSDRVASDGNQI